MGYELFTVEPLWPHDAPLAITAAYRNPGGYLTGEWFVLIPGTKPDIFAQRARFNYKEFPDDLCRLDEDFMQREMLDQARLRLRRYIDEKNIDLGPGRARWQPELLKANRSLFVHLWIRGGYADDLVKVSHATGCEALRADIEAMFGLEGYSRRDL